MLDVYAAPYIPQWQIAINSNPARTILTRPAEQIDYASSTLELGRLLSPYRSHLPPLDLSSTAKDLSLSPESYYEYFDDAILLETQALLEELGRANMYNVPMRLVFHDNELTFTCELKVPGLREYSPQVFVGDTVSLRQVLPDSAFPLDFIQYDAVVTLINRASEFLDLAIYRLRPSTMRFNVIFQLQASRIEPSRLAILMAQEGLVAERDPTSASNSIKNGLQEEEFEEGRASRWLSCMLFPSTADSSSQTTLNRAVIDRQWHDPVLNYEQQRAVDSICSRCYGKLPFLISGPPGTGKTKTLVETALQLLDIGVSSLLICAPSDQAADTLTQRLRDRLSQSKLLRLTSPSRSFAEVPGDVLPYCFVKDNSFDMPPINILMKYQVVVSSCRDAAMLMNAGVTNQDLFRLEHGLLSTLHPTVQRKYVLHWQGLLIDEAAQAIEPEAAIPLAIVKPPTEAHLLETQPLFIMAGDQQQLGPRTSSRQPVIETSLFERLIDRDVYAKHPFARSKTTGKASRTILTQDMLPIPRPAFSNLIRNYRSHTAILAMPSKLFYHDTLLPEAPSTDGLLSWRGWRGRRWPVLFTSTIDDDELDNGGGGWYNVSEAQKACDLAASLFKSGLIAQKDICIISPFRTQVQRLRKLARSEKYGLWDVNIGPLEAFQGLESRMVILCTTRTRERFLQEDQQRGWGIVHDFRRFNVAMTRAKEGLIVIGSEEVLRTNDNWRAFLGFCDRHGLCDGESQGAADGAATGGPVSILETAMLMKEAGPASGKYVGLSLAAGLDEEMMLSGIAAELQLGSEDEEALADAEEDEVGRRHVNGLDNQT